MNRLKLWIFALLLIGAAGVALRALSADLGARALQAVDARLVAASARVSASQRAIQGDVGAVAALAARDPALIHALADEGGRRRARAAADGAQESEAQQVARTAVAAAETELAVTLPQGAHFNAAPRAWLDGRAQDPQADATAAFLREALGGTARRGFLRTGDGLAYGVAVPAGAGVLGVFVPVDAAWLAALSGGSGADLTIGAPGLRPVSSARGGAEPLLQAAASGPGTVRDAGRLAPVPVDAGVKLGDRGPLLASFPSHRVIGLPLAGVKDGAMVVSVPTRPLLAPLVELEWRGVAGLALAAVMALLFGLLLAPSRAAARVPPELLSAAERIERGDLSARAPWLPGELGTVASALNHAAEAASPGAAAPSLVPPPEASAAEPSWVPSRPAPTPRPSAPTPDAVTLPSVLAAPGAARATPSPARAPEPAFAAATAPEPSFAAAAAPEPGFAGVAAPEPAFAPLASPEPAPTLLFGGAALAREPAPAADPAPPEPAPVMAGPSNGVAAEEEHWREVFREFMRVRAECGEPTQGLTYERLRAKLESNRAALMAKYGCRTVRFQVYVKEGKTALKATPVR